MREQEIRDLYHAYQQVYSQPQEIWEEVENWVNSLMEEGYDLSEYTWEEMYEAYIEEQGIPTVPRVPSMQQMVQKGIENQKFNTAFGRAAEQLLGKPGQRPVPRQQQPRQQQPRQQPPAPRQQPPAPSRPAAGAPPSRSTDATTPARRAAGTTPAKPTSTPTLPAAERRTPTSAELRAAQGARSSALASGQTKPEAEKAAVQAGIDRGTKLMGGPEGPGKIDTASVQRDLAKANAPKSTPTPAAKPAGPSLQQSIRNRRLNMSFDPFDVVIGHLLDEGYAETPEAAEAIMANMSEDWRESIFEEIGIVGPPKKPIDAIPGVRALRIAASNAVKRSDYPADVEPPMAGKHVIPTDRYGTAKPRPMTSSEYMSSRASGTGMRMPGYKDISGD